MGKIYKDETDLTYLEWTKTRHSSGTAGSFLKAYEKKGNKKLYYKLSNYDVANGIVGHECVNEIIVDRLLSVMGIEHLEYDLINAKVKIRDRIYQTYLCRSYDFKKEGESKIALDAYYDMEHVGDETPIEFCNRMGFVDYIYKMLTIDYLIMNRDRHGANIEIMKNRKSHKYYPAPLFDHGLSLLCSCMDDKDFVKMNPLDEKRVQCFVGGNNTFDNLKLIPDEDKVKLPDFDDELKNILFQGLDGIMPDLWIDCVWRFLVNRAKQYEDIFNKE